MARSCAGPLLRRSGAFFSASFASRGWWFSASRGRQGQVIDGIVADIKSNHIARLQKGHCTIEMGFVLSDLLTNCERVSDHCSNIAVAQIETALNAYQAHEYLNALKTGGDAFFRNAFDGYRAQFAIAKERMG